MSIDAADDGEAANGKQKHRSPNHPVIGLEKAVERAAEVLNSDGQMKLAVGLVHDRWGYKRNSAAGNQVVAALKSYGFVDVEGTGEKRRIGITDCARRIIKGAPNRDELLRAAALCPPIHAELWARYHAHGVPKDDVLREYLLWERPDGTFNEESVDSFIANFRSTIDYAKVAQTDNMDALADALDPKGNRLPVVGDMVWWQGPGELLGPTLYAVGSVAEDGQWVFLQGVPDGVPMSEVTIKKAEVQNLPPRNPGFGKPDGIDEPSKPGMEMDRTNLKEGAVVLQWPSQLTEESVEELEYWINGVLRRARRKAGMPPEPKSQTNPNAPNGK